MPHYVLASCVVGAGLVILGAAIGGALAVINDPSESDAEPCVKSAFIRRGEQVYCNPGEDYAEDWFAKLAVEGDDYAKVYRTTKTKLDTTKRTFSYHDYKKSLSNEYNDFPIYVPISVDVVFDYTCSGTGCKNAKMYILTQSDYDKSVDGGTFYYSKVNPSFVNFPNGTDSLSFTKSGPETFHLMLCQEDGDLSASFEGTYKLTYTVYDLHSLEAATCADRCNAGKGERGDIIIVDYPSNSTSVSLLDPGREPLMFNTTINYYEVSWVGVGAILVLVGGLGLVVLIGGIGFLAYTIYRGKAIKRRESSPSKSSNTTTMESIPPAREATFSEPTPTFDGGMGSTNAPCFDNGSSYDGYSSVGASGAMGQAM